MFRPMHAIDFFFSLSLHAPLLSEQAQMVAKFQYTIIKSAYHQKIFETMDEMGLPNA